MIIVIDSNILIQYGGFDSHNMQNLLDFAQKTNSYIYLHKLVIEEVSANITRDCAEATEKLNKELDKLSKWGAKIPAFHKEELEKPLLDKFKNQVTIPRGVSIGPSPESQGTNGFPQIIINRKIIAPLDASDLDEATTRMIKRIPPCSEKGEEFRDTMIWLNMLRYCQKHYAGCPIAFISRNKNEFAEKDDTLKERLLEDVRRYGLDLEYFLTVPDFMEKHAEPIEHINRDWINSHINIEKVKEFIRTIKALENLKYYNNIGQEISLEYENWDIELKNFYVSERDKNLEYNLTYKVIIKDNIISKTDRNENVDNIGIEFTVDLKDNSISFKTPYVFRYDSI